MLSLPRKQAIRAACKMLIPKRTSTCKTLPESHGKPTLFERNSLSTTFVEKRRRKPQLSPTTSKAKLPSEAFWQRQRPPPQTSPEMLADEGCSPRCSGFATSSTSVRHIRSGAEDAKFSSSATERTKRRRQETLVACPKLPRSRPRNQCLGTPGPCRTCTAAQCLLAPKRTPEPSEVTAKISEVKQTLGLAPKCRKVLPWKARYARHSSTSANSNCFCASAVRQSWDLCCQWQWPCEAGPTASHGSNETIQSEAAGDEDPFFNVRVPMVLVP